MAGLKSTTIASGYKSLIRIDDNSGVSGTPIRVTDGEGDSTALKISNVGLQVIPASADGDVFRVYSKDLGDLLRINSSTNFATILGNYVNTQYAYFGATSQATTANTAGYHYPLQFNCASIGLSDASADQLNIFGNGTDPATSVTTAEASDQRASNLVPYMMYVPDNIYIDAIYSVEGADAATGDTTRFHCMSYTFTSGSTSCLTSGTLIAHSDDETNAGSEQVYLNTWNMDSNTVAAGKVLICTFEPVSVNSDYAYTVTIKYHLV